MAQAPARLLQAFLPPLPPPSIGKNALSNFGTIRKIFKGPASGKTVIHIQDVHGNEEAQRNIGRAIQELINMKQVDLIALEGAVGPIDVSAFQSYPDKEITLQAADGLLRENRISGPIHAAFTSPRAFPRMVGVDDAAHYQANVLAVRQSAALEKACKEKLAGEKRLLGLRKTARFNPGLASFDRRVEAYRRSEISMGTYARWLSRQKKEVPPQIKLFLATLDLESSLDFAQVEHQRTRLFSEMVPNLTKAESAELANAVASHRSGQLPSADFYSFLKNLCSDKRINLSRFPPLNSYFTYVLSSNRIDMEKISGELRSLEESIYATLARTPEEKSLVHESRRLYLTGKLLNFALTKEEWEELRSTNDELRSTNLKSFENFYREAEIRDDKMASNLIRYSYFVPRTSMVVLVTGGFHSAGIDRRLAEAGTTVIQFVPKITKIDTANGSAYLSVFTQEKTPLEKIFEGEKLFLSQPVWAPSIWRISALGMIFNGAAVNSFRKFVPGLLWGWGVFKNTGLIIVSKFHVSIVLSPANTKEPIVWSLDRKKQIVLAGAITLLSLIAYFALAYQTSLMNSDWEKVNRIYRLYSMIFLDVLAGLWAAALAFGWKRALNIKFSWAEVLQEITGRFFIGVIFGAFVGFFIYGCLFPSINLGVFNFAKGFFLQIFISPALLDPLTFILALRFIRGEKGFARNYAAAAQRLKKMVALAIYCFVPAHSIGALLNDDVLGFGISRVFGLFFAVALVFHLDSEWNNRITGGHDRIKVRILNSPYWLFGRLIFSPLSFIAYSVNRIVEIWAALYRFFEGYKLVRTVHFFSAFAIVITAVAALSLSMDATLGSITMAIWIPIVLAAAAFIYLGKDTENKPSFSIADRDADTHEKRMAALLRFGKTFRPRLLPLLLVSAAVIGASRRVYGASVNAYGYRHAERMAILNSFEKVIEDWRIDAKKQSDLDDIQTVLNFLKLRLATAWHFPREVDSYFSWINKKLGEPLRDCIIYVSIEPCMNCATLIAEMKIKTVFFAHTDLNPVVNGKGLMVLKDRGIEIWDGLGQENARKQNRLFFKVVTSFPKAYRIFLFFQILITYVLANIVYLKGLYYLRKRAHEIVAAKSEAETSEMLLGQDLNLHIDKLFVDEAPEKLSTDQGRTKLEDSLLPEIAPARSLELSVGGARALESGA